MALNEGSLQPEALTLQQRVELPIWHPAGMRGLHDDPDSYNEQSHQQQGQQSETENEEEEIIIVADNPRPEDWLPKVMEEVCQDILHVIETLDATLSYNMPGNVSDKQ
jgi:hypothetical protein